MEYELSISEILNSTLENYCPLVKKETVKILDAMSGFWSYSKTLLDYFSKHYSVKSLMGVEKDNYWEGFSTIFEKPLEYLNCLVEELPSNYNKHFDIITNFSPRCTSQARVNSLMPAYKRIREMLKEDGIFFATTYNYYEMDNLYYLVRSSGFEAKTVKKNKFDESESYYGWVLIATP